ncbi:response regulator transcription factor [Sphingobacterium sp. SRCM116780]|uniref:response regulator transcription factor n=1 Tax=Sphingobacterium sp. SRCM116780 TaxID=2907623 RepID=UPI001F45984B|nr:response regulator transcription factor [Sphingobacterium sp. SRCM116780]UIR56028.1 response regulator transcription factor [Sphingobacterium sp. SRCM116780]
MEGKILLIEDDQDLGPEVQWCLERNGFKVNLVDDGIKALDLCKTQIFDLLLVDVQLPSLDGFELIKQLKLIKPDFRFLFLTARNTKDSCIAGLKLGAEDYITKPFDTEELLWRMNNILARGREKKIEQLHVADVTLYCNTMELMIGEGKTIRLTNREFELWKYLMQNLDRVLMREEILTKLWGESDYFMGRSLDVFISKIRKILLGSSQLKIETVYKVGFIIRLIKS